MRWLKWFVAGLLAVPLFHQIALLLLGEVGMTRRAPFAMEATKPFGVPAVVSLSFWGGVWGVILGLVLLRIRSTTAWWMTAILFGAIVPTLAAIFVVAPLKGQAVQADAKMLIVGLIINAAWGLGTAAIYRLMSPTLRG